MIQRRALLVSAVMLLASTTLARADEVGDIVRWLRGLGFDDVATSRSLLGRVQIRATGAIGTRELVVNPRTGEVLRDVWVDTGGKLVRGAPYSKEDDDHGGDSNGRGGSDDGDDDNSGHGGGDDGGDDGDEDDDGEGEGESDNSGSGGGGSGGGGSDD